MTSLNLEKGIDRSIELLDMPSSLSGEALKFLQVNPGETAYELVDAPSGGSALLVDDRANILAIDPSVGSIAFAEDTKKFYVSDGTDWNQAEIRMSVDEPAPDIGAEKNSPPLGYGETFITSKDLSNCRIQGNFREENGAIRIDVNQEPDTFEIYLRDAWQTILYDLTVEAGALQHAPINETINIYSGDSVKVAGNGLPIIQQYKKSIGAEPVPLLIDCGGGI